MPVIYGLHEHNGPDSTHDFSCLVTGLWIYFQNGNSVLTVDILNEDLSVNRQVHFRAPAQGMYPFNFQPYWYVPYGVVFHFAHASEFLLMLCDVEP